MNGRVVLAILLLIAVIAVAAGIGVSAYNWGVTQGLAESGKLAVPAPGVMFYPYAGGFFHPFGLFGFLIPLFFLFLFFGLLRALFWHGRWGGRGAHGLGSEGVPPRFEEWHRRLHEQGSGEQGRR